MYYIRFLKYNIKCQYCLLLWFYTVLCHTVIKLCKIIYNIIYDGKIKYYLQQRVDKRLYFTDNNIVFLVTFGIIIMMGVKKHKRLKSKNLNIKYVLLKLKQLH